MPPPASEPRAAPLGTLPARSYLLSTAPTSHITATTTATGNPNNRSLTSLSFASALLHPQRVLYRLRVTVHLLGVQPVWSNLLWLLITAPIKFDRLLADLGHFLRAQLADFHQHRRLSLPPSRPSSRSEHFPPPARST
jgi:hypothetical protein